MTMRRHKRGRSSSAALHSLDTPPSVSWHQRGRKLQTTRHRSRLSNFAVGAANRCGGPGRSPLASMSTKSPRGVASFTGCRLRTSASSPPLHAMDMGGPTT
eukprot:5750224-Prymnesium_polylepis.1